MLDGENKARLTERLVHLDLKGAPPRISFFEHVLPLISSWGATGILIEYEDSFPFYGDLAKLKSPSSYSVQQIKELLLLCQRNDLKTIPLVQTFGHLEFVLKHDSFRHLREVDLYPNALCPFHPSAFDVIQMIIMQVIELHPDSSYLHIGADEVWHIGKCERCQFEMTSRNWEVCDLFLYWVSKLASCIKEKFSKLKLIIWDDMMREIPLEKLVVFNENDLVEPMIWKYEASEFNFPPGLFEKFGQAFDTIWGASCFKGATGCTQFLPPIQHHIDNQLAWLSLLNRQHSKFKEVKGIALTGWQRYDHYAVLCELFPVSLPSLALCLRVLKTESFRREDHEAISQEMGFVNPINVFPFPRPQIVEQGMSFPGHEVYSVVQMWSNIVNKYQVICNSQGVLGWFSEYFRSRNFTNPAQVEAILFQLVELEENLTDLQSHMERCLLDIFFEDTVEEWIGCFIKPLLSRITKIISDCKTQIKVGGRVKDYGLNKDKER